MSRKYAISDLLEASSNYYVTLLEDFTHGSSVNLVNVYEFESLVSQLETSFNSPDVPPLDIFRILLTLSGRLDEINFALNESIHGADVSKNAMQSLHYVDMHGTGFELRQRSLNILHTYVRMVRDLLLSLNEHIAGKLNIICKYLSQSIFDFFSPIRRMSELRLLVREDNSFEHLLSYYREEAKKHNDIYDSKLVIKQITENSLAPKLSRVAQQLTGLSISDSLGVTRLSSPVSRRTPEPEKHEADLLKRIKIFDDWLVGRKISDMNSGNVSKGYWEVVQMTIAFAERSRKENVTQWEANAFFNLYKCYSQFLRLVLDITMVNLLHQISIVLQSYDHEKAADHLKELGGWKYKQERASYQELKRTNAPIIIKNMFPQKQKNSVEALIRSVLVECDSSSHPSGRARDLRTIYGRDRHFIEHQLKVGSLIMEDNFESEQVRDDAINLAFEHMLVLYYFSKISGTDSSSPFADTIPIICDMLLKLSLKGFEQFFCCAIAATRTELHFVSLQCALEFLKEISFEVKANIPSVITLDSNDGAEVDGVEQEIWEILDDYTSCVSSIELDDDLKDFQRKLCLFSTVATARTAIALDQLEEVVQQHTLISKIQAYNSEIRRHYNLERECYVVSEESEDSTHCFDERTLELGIQCEYFG